MGIVYNTRTVNDNVVFKFDVQNPKSYNGVSNIWFDMSGNSYHADYINASTTVHSFNNSANPKYIQWNGGEVLGSGGFRIRDLNYVTGPSDQIPNLTLETWVAVDDGTSGNSGDQRILLSFDRSAVFRWTISDDTGNSDGKPSFMFVDGSQRDRHASSFPDLRDNQWHHLVVTFESGVAGGLKYYLDGELTHTDTGTYNPIGSHSESETPRYGVIGGGSEVDSPTDVTTSPESFFKGKMATMAMYYKTFTPEEVKLNFNALRDRFQIATQPQSPTGLSYVDVSVSQGSAGFSVPGTSQTGDIVLYMSRWLVNDGRNTIDESVDLVNDPQPSGFQLVGKKFADSPNSADGTNNYFYVYYKIDDGTLAGAEMPTSSGSNFDNQMVIVLRPSITVNSITLNGYANNRDAGNPSAITTLSSNATTPALVVGYQRNTSTGQGFDEAESPEFEHEVSLGDGSGGTLAWSVYNDNPVDHTIDVSDRASTYNMLVAFWLEFGS